MANIASDSLAGRTERSQSVGDIDVDFAGVCLAGDDECRLKAGFFGDEFVEFLDLGVVSVEDFYSNVIS